MSVALAAALDRLDAAFGPRSDSLGEINGCDHCVADDERAILGGPVAAIPDRLLVTVLFNWPHTLGDPKDARLIRRITPRLLRLMASDTLHVDESLVAHILNRAGWHGWPDAERLAVDEFCAAWFRSCLLDDDAPSVFAALDFLVPLTADVTRWLACWSATPDSSADEQLLAALTRWREELAAGELDLFTYTPGLNIAPAVTDFLLEEIPRRIPGVLTDDESAILALIAERPQPAATEIA